MTSLSAHLHEIAQERLALLQTLSYDQLATHQEAEASVVSSWWCRGDVWEEITQVAPDALRIAVLQTATIRFWPSYYHRVQGFRIRADGSHLELTAEDMYDLD